MSLYYQRTNCRLCLSNDLELVIPLKPIPIITPNIADTDETSELIGKTLPVEVFRCLSCGLMQLLTVINPILLYKNLTYETSISLGLKDHFAKFADHLLTNFNNIKNVLEIGSNDGLLLEVFKERNINVLGVDPATKIAAKANKKELPTLNDFFSKELSDHIVEKYGKQDLIIANNTLANVDDMHAVIDGVHNCLNPEGVFVFEVQYGIDVLDNLLVDLIYHEHLSYFTVKPLVSFFEKKGMQIFKVERIPTKGGSLRVYVNFAKQRLVDISVEKLIHFEVTKGFYTPFPFQIFANHINSISNKVAELAEEFFSKGDQIAVYGSSVGCISLINQFMLGKYLSFIVDDNPFKDKVIGPDYSLDIIHRNDLSKHQPKIIIILAWRYAQFIIDKNKEYLNNNGSFLVPLPDIKLISQEKIAV